MTNRIDRRFADLKAAGRAGLVTFLVANDPDHETFARALAALPGAGADLIEIGMPFTDPMADGPAIQAASLRALAAGGSLGVTLDAVRTFRIKDDTTPIVLMGYYNPVHAYGPDRFARDAGLAGVDGLILVDLPPEEDAELSGPAADAGIHLIRLVTPVTTPERLAVILRRAAGFLYYVSITGVTGTARADDAEVTRHLAEIRTQTDLPLAVGFGIRTPDDARAKAAHADAVVVGSALVERMKDGKVGDMLQDVQALKAALGHPA